MQIKKENKIIHGLWIGEHLSPVEQLTILSFINHGHNFQLWTYSDSINAPNATILKDANEIIPQADVFCYQHTNQFGHGKGSYAGFSDLFRYKLLLEHGGIWVDMDVTCLKPFDFASPYLFRAHHKNGLVGNIMKCPPNSELMHYCYEQAKTKINSENRDWMLPLAILKNGIIKFNLMHFVQDISNEDSWPKVSKLLTSKKGFNNNWHAIHWMNEEWRRLQISKEQFVEQSLIFELMQMHAIEFTKYDNKLKLLWNTSRVKYGLINLPHQLKSLLNRFK